MLPEPMGPTGGNLPHGQDAGFLGKAHDPFVADGRSVEAKDFKVPDLLPPPEIGEARLAAAPQAARRSSTRRSRISKPARTRKLMDSNFEAAYRLMTSPQAREAFDLTKEPTEVRERYGMNRFGQCCLLARRLIEAGVRFVTVNTFLTVFNEITWDIHGSNPFTSHRGHEGHRRADVRPGLQRADRRSRASAACSTTRWSATWPSSAARRKVNPAGGRDHWPQCWTVYFAGGGVQRRPRGRQERRHRRLSGRAAGRAGRSRGHDLPVPRPRPGNRIARPARPAVPAGGSRTHRSRNCSNSIGGIARIVRGCWS